jgi:hypothetical protein
VHAEFGVLRHVLLQSRRVTWVSLRSQGAFWDTVGSMHRLGQHERRICLMSWATDSRSHRTGQASQDPVTDRHCRHHHGTIEGRLITFTLTQTSATCPGTFSGHGTVLSSPKSVVLFLTGSDCVGAHTGEEARGTWYALRRLANGTATRSHQHVQANDASHKNSHSANFVKRSRSHPVCTEAQCHTPPQTPTAQPTLAPCARS